MPMEKFLRDLEGKVFKSIPIFETDRNTLNDYLNSLLVEMEGAKIRFPLLSSMNGYDDILNTIAYFASRRAYGHSKLKTEIFKCLSILNKLNQLGGEELD